MTLITFKWLAAIIILLVSLVAGLGSLRLVNKYRSFLRIGDAAADGIFIGAAVFHLLPNAVHQFNTLDVSSSFIIAALLLIISFIIFILLHHVLHRFRGDSRSLHVWILTIILSIHAMIAGLTLGISETLTIISVIFVAIAAHKGFETFALMMSLHRNLIALSQVILILILFSLVTPIGIMLGSMSSHFLQTNTNILLTACFSAIAAGTFLYIGTIHTRHQHYPVSENSYQRYSQFLATVAGIVLMAIVAIWV